MGRNDVLCHNVGLYNPEPRAIHCMVLERHYNKIALSRSDNSVEIWDVEFLPSLEKIIINENHTTVEDLGWFGTRLFSCGLQGSVLEYDCYNESILLSVHVTGGPVWCLGISSKNNLLACGTEGGYINIFEITSDGLEHYKLLDKQQGRILCLCWEKSGQHLITGSTDVIRVWNVEKGHAVHKMMTGRSQPSTETIVWSLNVTRDFIIISGDSRGYLCFWDGKLGTQIECFQSHDADIFSVALNEDESTVYCSGVDPVIAIYGRLLEKFGSKRKWAKGGIRRGNQLDVRALAVTSNEKLFSGTADGFMTVNSYPVRNSQRYPSFLKVPYIKLLKSKRYLMFRYPSHLELWKLGQCDAVLRLSERQMKLLVLKAKDGDIIIAASISANGTFIAYSTNTAVRFFKLNVDSNSSLIKLPDPTDCGPCRIIEFYQNKKRQFCALVTKKNDINIMEVGESGPDIVHCIKPKENELLMDTISHLVVTSDGSYLVASDCSGSIVVWSMVNWSYYCHLPRYKASVTCMAMNNDTYCLAVAYSDLKLVEFSLKEKKYTDFSKRLNNNLNSCLRTPVLNICFDPRRDSAIIVHDYFSICVLYDDGTGCGSGKKVAKIQGTRDVMQNEVKMNIVKKSKYLVFVDWLEGDEMVMVSVSPLKLAEKFPPAFNRKRFIK